ncbi:hypothetical protein RI129_011813 [Pyrocoelia pectoralis]|uniref:Transforming acidic coiled-coil-containing protein C-terminal domain-containing protein n=1 Tax=Pyrocoelia pectoralis TaxID=417401 RepID=A0AAN7ZG71_9COLE
MFVSSVLKKCVNLLSYDSTKNPYDENDCKSTSSLAPDLDHEKGDHSNNMELHPLEEHENTESHILQEQENLDSHSLQAQENIDDLALQAQENVDDLALQAQENVDDLALQAQENVDDLALQARENVDDLALQAQENVDDLALQAQENVDDLALQAQENVDDLALQARENVDDLALQAQENVDDLALQAQENVDDLALQAQENVDDLALQAQENVDDLALHAQENVDDLALQAQENVDDLALQAQENVDDLALHAQENVEIDTLQEQEDNVTTSFSCSDCTVFNKSGQSKTEGSLHVQRKKCDRPRRSVLATFDPLFVDSKTSENTLIVITEDDSILPTYNDGSDEFDFDINTLEYKFLNISEPEPSQLTYEKTDLTDKIQQLEEENASLKLQLNSSQHLNTRLELQLIENEEMAIKTQTEALEKDHAANQEIKQLKDKLEEQVLESGKSAKVLKETTQSLKQCETKLLSESLVFKNNEDNYRKVIVDYENVISSQLSELQKVNKEHNRIKKHFENLEMAFSDVHLKYERAKIIVDGYKTNEDTLRQTLTLSRENLLQSEEKYEILKVHAKEQIEKANQELHAIRDKYEAEIHKLTAVVKRLEIKVSSLEDSLDQKVKECSSLSALCDEFTGKM